MMDIRICPITILLVLCLCYWAVNVTRRRTKAESDLSEQRLLAEAVINEILRLSLELVPLDIILDRVLGRILSIPWLAVQSKGAIFLAEGGKLVMKAQRGLGAGVLKSCATVPPGRCLCGRVLASGVMEYRGALDPSHDTVYPGIKPHGHYSIPIKHGTEILGVLTLYLDEGHKKKDADVSFLEVVADILAGILLRDRAERALTHQEDQFRALTENVLDIITVIDAKGEMLYHSPSVEKLLGLPPTALVGRNLVDFVHPEDMPKVRGAMATAISERDRPQFVELRMRRDDGCWRTVESIGKYMGEGPSGSRIVVNSRDVTERKELEEQFRQSQKMEALGKMAGGVAHDFNNILTAFIGYVGFLQVECAGNVGALSDLDELRRSAERATSLTRQLLAFSRKQVLLPRIVDLNASIEGMRKMLSLLSGGNIELVTALAATPVTVLVDPGQLEQVLLNLTANARDAMPSGGRITISTSVSVLDSPRPGNISEMKPGRYAVVSVGDTGTGMDEATQSRIFEPFFTTKGPGAGTGLGLATVYGIVRQSGGDIALRSELGAGTIFSIYLPLSDGAVEAGVESENRTPPRSGTETILLVEDDSVVRGIAGRILRERGYTVLESSRDSQAFLLAGKNRGKIDLLLTDIVLPGLNGYELAAKIAAENPRIKVAFTSGHTDSSALRSEAVGTFIQKPFAPEALLSGVRAALDS